MSGALPVVSGKETVQALQRAGFAVISTRGSHQKLRHHDGRVVIVPLHRQWLVGPCIHPSPGGFLEQGLKLLPGMFGPAHERSAPYNPA